MDFLWILIDKIFQIDQRTFVNRDKTMKKLNNFLLLTAVLTAPLQLLATPSTPHSGVKTSNEEEESGRGVGTRSKQDQGSLQASKETQQQSKSIKLANLKHQEALGQIEATEVAITKMEQVLDQPPLTSVQRGAQQQVQKQKNLKTSLHQLKKDLQELHNLLNESSPLPVVQGKLSEKETQLQVQLQEKKDKLQSQLQVKIADVKYIYNSLPPGAQKIMQQNLNAMENELQALQESLQQLKQSY